jgi:glucan 1,3-beta-glucosidase
MRATPILVALILMVAAGLSSLYWWEASRPKIIVDALSDHLSCVSYAPYYRTSDSPFEKSTYIDAARIDSDLALLAQRFDCVRTYSVGQGLHVVPELAQKHGMKTLMGIWIGGTPADNEKELAKGIDTAKKYGSSLRAIIVGNEVLLRGEQPASKIREYLDRVHAAVPQIPITYADVWEFWLKNQDLKSSVDFATVHILPYWEDRPIPVSDAAGHVSHIYHHVRDVLKGKSVMIGETGWPSYGRRRLGAVPGLVEEARFIREFQVRAQLENIPYNVIEAFDQAWKRKQEGAVGGYWGIFDRFGQAKFPFKGPVAEAPLWSLTAILAALAYFGLFLYGWSPLRSRFESILLFLVSLAGGGLSTAFWRELWMANRTLLEWAATVPYALLLSASILAFGGAITGWCTRGISPSSLAPMTGLIRWIRRNEKLYDGSGLFLGSLRFAFLFGAAYVSVLLVFDPRYRDFPLALYTAPAVGMAILSWIQIRISIHLEEIVLAGWIGFAGIWVSVTEHLLTPPEEAWHFAGTINPSALLWTLVSLLLSGSILIPALIERRARQYQYA